MRIDGKRPNWADGAGNERAQSGAWRGSIAMLLFAIGLTLGAAMAEAQDADAAKSQGKQEEPSCRTMHFFADGKPLPASKPRFQALKNVDLGVRLILPSNPVKGTKGELTVRFVTPNGALYEERVVPFADAGNKEKERRVAGYPFPVAVKVIESNGAGAQQQSSVTVTLPVGGTTITGSGLYGSWTVIAQRDKLPTCQAEVSITP